MADNPDYSAGTVSVTTGTKTVTGVGTFWASAGLLAGDTFGSDGHPRARIASINSNTSITLMDNWRGPTLAAGSSYWIRYQADGSRYAAILGEVRRMISGSANLSALSGLQGGPNKLPFFNGVGSMDQTDVTLASLAMLAVAGFAGVDRVPVLTGPNSATFRNVMSNRQAYGDDLSIVNVRGAGPAALSRSGDYYNASAGINVDNEPAGSIGLYNTANPGTPTWPGIANWWITTQQTFTGDSSYQRAVGYSSAIFVVFGRHRITGGAWTSWQPETVVGGSNANGQFLRFTDGTQICYFRESVTMAVTSPTGQVFRDAAIPAWTFPMPFSTVTNLVGFNSVNSTFLWASGGPGSASTQSRAVIGSVTFSGAAVVSSIAIGRWY